VAEGTGVATSADLASFFEGELTRLYGLCFKMLQDTTEAEDAVQETAMRAIRSIDRFRGEAALPTWVFRICVNVCRDRIQDRARDRKALENARIDALWRDEHYSVDPSLVEVTSAAGTDGDGHPARPIRQGARMSLTCGQARVMASDLLDDSLTEEDRIALLAHIETCASCPQLYRSMAAIYQQMHTASPATPSQELRRQVRQLFRND